MTRTHKVIVNNYQLGAKVKSTPTHKIGRQDRLDKTHTAIYYEDLTSAEIDMVQTVLAKKLQFVGFRKAADCVL